MSDPRRILVVANETVGGTALIQAVKKRADQGQVQVHVVCPQNQPKHGYVIYEGTVREAAENRLNLTIAQLREAGVEADGEVMDPDPYAAIIDALQERDYDEIIISTHPETRSGWLRQDLVSRVERETELPVEHVVVDLEADREQAKQVLVVANQTVGGEPLIEQLKKLAQEGPHRFVVIVPAGEGGEEEAAQRLAHTLKRLEEGGLPAIGQVVHPDPFTAVQNALQFYPADEIVVSTFPETRSGWLREDLVQRIKDSTTKSVYHVVSEGAPEEVGS
jgi:DNA-binding LacI/PurR family transcriptional regulator